MKSTQIRIFLLGMLILLSSCDLLGIGNNDNDDHNKNAPDLIWKDQHSIAGLSSGNVTSIRIDNGNVYLWGFGLAKLKLSTGSLLWGYSIQKNPVPQEGQNLSTGARNFLLTDQKVVLAFPDGILALSKKDGKPLWTTQVSLVSAQNESSIYESPGLPMAQTSTRVFIGGQNKVVGLNKTSGSLELTISVGTFAQHGKTVNVIHLITAAGSAPLLFASTEYVSGKSQFQLPIFKRNLIAINSENGKTLWVSDLSRIAKDSSLPPRIVDLAFADNQLIVLARSVVIALAPNTGNIKWKTQLQGLGQGQLVTADNSIYVSAFSEGVLRIDASDGTVLWQAQTTSGEPNGMVVDNGHLYYSVFSNQDAGIWVIGTGQGKIKRIIRKSDLKDVGLGFFLGFGLDVKGPYLVKQGLEYTYGIKL